jgi:prophage regulatory protein
MAAWRDAETIWARCPSNTSASKTQQTISQFSIAEAPVNLWASLGIDPNREPASTEPRAMAAPRLITYADLKPKGIALGKQRIWQLEQEGKFPKRVATSPRRHAWVESEIDDYLAAKIAKRDAGDAA